MMSNIKGVILDMDGTIVDSEPLHARSWEVVLRGYGQELEEEWFVPWVGIPDELLAVHLVENRPLPMSDTELLAEKRAKYRELVSANILVFDGVVEGLAGLRERHIAYAVASNSVRQDVHHTLKCANLYHLFSTVVTFNDVKEGKPAPDIFLLAAERMGIAPSACVVIEDSPAGLEAARAAGCCVIAVTTGHTADQLPPADQVFSEAGSALKSILESL